MMKNISPLQIGIYVVFGIAIVFAVLIFSGKISIGGTAASGLSGNVVMWGTLPADGMNMVQGEISTHYPNLTLQYVQMDPSTFQSTLINALASGTGPDLIATTTPDIVQNYSRLLTIPFTSLPQSTFEDTFIDQGTQYLNSNGTLAFPFVVDPLVMYYNKDMLTSAFVTNPPATWDDVIALNKKITVADDSGTLSAETVAMGTYDNILHAKQIIVMLCQQSGNPLVSWDPGSNQYISDFKNTDSAGNSGVANALSFYTSFANPSSPDYSWNSTLPTDQQQFLAGKLALYFGYASEAATLRQENPNLNFGVATMPYQTGGTRSTYGEMTGIAIVKITKNPTNALAMAQTLVGSDVVKGFLAIDSQYAPARKDLLGDVSNDDLQTTINRSAIISKSFLDPNTSETSALFQKYVDEINEGVATPAQILDPGDSLMTSILKEIQPPAPTQ